MACFLKILRPDGQVYNPNEHVDGKYPLSEMIKSSEKAEIIIGRVHENATESTNIYLPADDMEISRKHCSIEIDDNFHSWVRSNSTNTTYLRKANSSGMNICINEKKDGYQLRNGDQILIPSKFPAQGNPCWACYFYDDKETERSNTIIYPDQTKYCYELISMKLYVENSDRQRQEIRLSGKPLKLVNYLADKVAKNDCAYIAEYDELISAIWKEQYGINNASLHNLKAQIRTNIIKVIGAEAPELIGINNTHGYRLENCRVIQPKLPE
jgi:FHA domain